MKTRNLDEHAALFVYGSLLLPERRVEILGHDTRTIAACLSGYRLLKGRYFYVVPDETAETHGLVMCDLSERELATLDRYEELPRLYRREQTVVRGESGEPIRCWIYLPAEALTGARG